MTMIRIQALEWTQGTYIQNIIRNNVTIDWPVRIDVFRKAVGW